jgi:sterol desaturase/sphingolipid hydroxylase (fatty acid hydroxylase superfamily)
MKNSTAHQSIRLFENDFLERLTHVHPIIPLLFWAPVASWLLWRTFFVHHLDVLPVLGIGALALVTWTLTEYSLHRFAFHYRARSKLGKRLVYLFHGNHHDDPRDKTRLVMPLSGAIPIMAALFLVFSLVIPAPWVEPFGAFFIVGYLIYDYIHYATHHFRMKNPVAKYLRQYHLKHHYSGEEGRYGVSSPLWDMVFGTTGARR